MKRCLLTLLLLVCPLLAPATEYSIFKLQGMVSVKKAGDTLWRVAARRDALAARDLLRLEENASVVILDTASGQLYKSAGSGEMLVYQVIQSAKASSAKTSALACQELVGEMKTNASEANDYRVGAVYRGDSDLHLLDSLAAHLFADDRIALTLMEEEDAMHVSLRNLAGEPLFVNVIRISPSGSRHVCFEFKPDSPSEGILLPPGASIDLPQYLFAADGSHYHPFATSFPYDTRALQRRL